MPRRGVNPKRSAVRIDTCPVPCTALLGLRRSKSCDVHAGTQQVAMCADAASSPATLAPEHSGGAYWQRPPKLPCPSRIGPTASSRGQPKDELAVAANAGWSERLDNSGPFLTASAITFSRRLASAIPILIRLEKVRLSSPRSTPPKYEKSKERQLRIANNQLTEERDALSSSVQSLQSQLKILEASATSPFALVPLARQLLELARKSAALPLPNSRLCLMLGPATPYQNLMVR